MLAKVYSAAVYGVDAFEVEIEVNAGSGNAKIIIRAFRITEFPQPYAYAWRLS